MVEVGMAQGMMSLGECAAQGLQLVNRQGFPCSLIGSHRSWHDMIVRVGCSIRAAHAVPSKAWKSFDILRHVPVKQEGLSTLELSATLLQGKVLEAGLHC